MNIKLIKIFIDFTDSHLNSVWDQGNDGVIQMAKERDCLPTQCVDVAAKFTAGFMGGNEEDRQRG